MTDTTAARPKILIADDSRVVRLTFTKHLAQQFDILEAVDGVQALEMLQQDSHIQLLFSDLGMPNMDGYQLIERIRNDEQLRLRELPIVVVTGADESEGVKDKVMALGATDLIRKPFDIAEVKSRATAYTGYSSKVTELEKHQAEDPLTGLTSKEYFYQQGEKMAAFAGRHGHEVTIVRMSIDRYQELTASLGQGMMRKILALVGDMLKKNLRQEDSAAYLGGPHFALALPGTDPDGAGHALRRVREKTANIHLKIGGNPVHIGFSTGIATQLINGEHPSFRDIMARAETASQQAVAAGGGKTARAPASPAPAAKAPSQPAAVNVSIDALLRQLSGDAPQISSRELASGLRQLLPLLNLADQQLKLGLAKVIHHLDSRLPK